MKEDVSRRLVLVGGLALAHQTLAACKHTDAEIADERKRLLGEADRYKRQLEISGVKPVVENLIAGEEAAWAVAETAYVHDQTLEMPKSFAADLEGKDQTVAHYAPRYWLGVRDFYEGDMVGIVAVSRLSNRLQTHAAFFGCLGSSELRTKRWEDWKNEELKALTARRNGNGPAWGINQDARMIMEEAKLKRDIALHTLEVRRFAGSRLGKFARQTDGLIQQWVDASLPSLQLPAYMNKETFKTLVKRDNPFR